MRASSDVMPMWCLSSFEVKGEKLKLKGEGKVKVFPLCECKYTTPKAVLQQYLNRSKLFF